MMKYNVKIIKTSKGTYLYDVATSNILELDNSFSADEDINAVLYALNNGIFLETPLFREFSAAIQSDYIQKQDTSQSQYWFNEDEYFANFQKHMNHLLIGVTENCNMRCKYCVYGGHYKRERIHSCKNMSYDTVKNAIDSFLSLSASKHFFINFYGGEPFFNFNLIQETSEYIKHKNVEYSIVITSNGTMLNDDIINWFSSNENVYIYISLAGPKNIHDKLRVFNSSNNGTFETIKKNVLKIKKFNLKAFSTRLRFVFNIFDEKQLFPIRDFWNSEEMFSGITELPEITMIDCLQDDGVVSRLGNNILNEIEDTRDPLDEYIRLLENNNHNDVFVNYYDNKFLFIHKRDTNDNSYKLSGVCQPFIHKFFVDVDGNVNICENFILDKYFGSVNKGVHLRAVKELLDKYKKARTEYCKDCWGIKLCSLCYKDLIDKDGTVNRARAEVICDNERKIIEESLKEYCTVLERNNSLLDHLNEKILVK